MNENKNIPQLFRDIFKGAFLPYRDPETLNLFLKEINSFSYEHSERLGDAFEYLLSVLGTQGDAGQFRTPRHIIDFIVAVVEPQKHETVLDPACGTAGFLISAYKHIVGSNEALTPDERARLMTNFRGYDISPDMVRLSLVNLYLHGFANPVIHEYDTLTSEERWDERCDVILANPPFMTPKGGIRPHNRFSIKARRSEVLFVDYIAEHLTPGGRAGVIVPEGIIFQSQNAYKDLRKMLVEDYLWAVVSLPAGVFNPYANVKTSILFLDRNLSRRTDKVLFVRIESDGFDLGAQRRPIDKDDLPQALKQITQWKNGQKKPQDAEVKMTQTICRRRLLESSDHNLSGDRYRVSEVVHRSPWPMVELRDVVTILSGGTPSKSVAAYWNGSIPWVSPKDMKSERIEDTSDHVTEEGIANSSAKLVPAGTVLCVIRSGILAHSFPVAIASVPVSFNQDIYAIKVNDEILPEFLFHVLGHLAPTILRFGVKRGGTVHSLRSGYLQSFQIPLPPTGVQRKIVAEVGRYRKKIADHSQKICGLEERMRRRIAAVWGDDEQDPDESG